VITADGSPVRIAYLRFAVTGIGSRQVARAVLRLTVDSASDAVSASGGRIRRITNNSWQERSVTYKNRPTLDGTVLATMGRVVPNQVVDFDVTAAVKSDGTYNLAVDSSSSDGARYRTREASSGKPRLIVTLR
jgi:hypothetical protein